MRSAGGPDKRRRGRHSRFASPPRVPAPVAAAVTPPSTLFSLLHRDACGTSALFHCRAARPPSPVGRGPRSSLAVVLGGPLFRRSSSRCRCARMRGGRAQGRGGRVLKNPARWTAPTAFSTSRRPRQCAVLCHRGAVRLRADNDGAPQLRAKVRRPPPATTSSRPAFASSAARHTRPSVGHRCTAPRPRTTAGISRERSATARPMRLPAAWLADRRIRPSRSQLSLDKVLMPLGAAPNRACRLWAVVMPAVGGRLWRLQRASMGSGPRPRWRGGP